MSSEPVIAGLLKEDLTLESQDLDYVHMVTELTDMITVQSHGEDTLVAALVGGAASGKITLATELIDRLSGKGLSSDSIGADDFLVGDGSFEGNSLRARSQSTLA